MKMAMIGLGKMGMGMTRRLLAKRHQVVAFDLNADVVQRAEKEGAIPASSLEEVVEKVDAQPRLVWLMLPAGEAVTLTLQELARLLGEGDIVAEGGESNYQQSIERATMLRYRGIHMLDVGLSGGAWGEEVGYNLVVGGNEEAFEQATPIFEALAPQGGFLHVGPSGAGHFVRMVHDGIEYGMMQSIAEGFELMAAKEEFALDLAALCHVWSNGSMIRSWLLDLAGKVLDEDPGLDWAETRIPVAGEERWTMQEALDLSIPLPVISLALQLRFHSRREESYTARLIAALHNKAD